MEKAINETVLSKFEDIVQTDAAREALHTLDELADLIIYHANVRANAKIMSETWEM